MSLMEKLHLRAVSSSFLNFKMVFCPSLPNHAPTSAHSSLLTEIVVLRAGLRQYLPWQSEILAKVADGRGGGHMSTVASASSGSPSSLLAAELSWAAGGIRWPRGAACGCEFGLPGRASVASRDQSPPPRPDTCPHVGVPRTPTSMPGPAVCLHGVALRGPGG